MKKFFITAIILIVTVLAMPAAGAFAAEKALEDIPTRGYTESGKAYCLYEEKDGEYVLTYVNSAGTKQLYKSKEKFKHNESFSEDGKTVFYSIDNKVYRYSYESGKRKKIYTVPENGSSYKRYTYVYSSLNGEYCAIRVEDSNNFDDDYKYDIEIILWHDGKTVSQTIKTRFGYTDSDNFYGVNDLGEVFYTLDKDIYILDLDGKRLAQKAPVPLSDEEDKYSNYEANIYPQNGTYIVRSEKDLYFGAVGGEQHKLSFSEEAQYYVLAQNGKGLIAYNGEYVARYDKKSGKSKNIVKMSPEKYWENRFNFMASSSDLNEVAYINYSKKKLVRLSDWDAKKNRYTNKQEIKLNGTGREHISNYSSDLSTILIGFADEKNNYYTADFGSGSFEQTEYYLYETDRFGHNIIRRSGKIEILNPDGSTTEVFDGVGATCEPWFSNGFYCFYSGGPDVPCDYEGEYDLTYYYICPKGKAVKWYDLEDTYMECHYLEDWDD